MSEKNSLEIIKEKAGFELSKYQLDILEQDGGMVIQAGAGSGKTTTLSYVIAKRIMDGIIKNPNKVLVATFSKKASEDITKRTKKVFKSLGISAKIEAKTLHSVFYSILRNLNMSFNVATKKQITESIREAVAECGIKLRNPDDELKEIESLISYQLNNMMTYEKLKDSYAYTLDLQISDFKNIKEKFSKIKRDKGIMDFDDMQFNLYMILKNPENVVHIEYCKNLYEHFFIDEFQDTSKLQYAILKVLFGDVEKVRSHMVIIGDEDQCCVSGTLVKTREEDKKIEDVEVGDEVLAAIGHGETGYYRVESISKKYIEEEVIVIKTKSGKELKATRNHMGFSRLEAQENVNYVYLMYKNNLGYRIGITSGIRTGKNSDHKKNGIEARLNQENGDKIWILKVTESLSEAMYLEALLSYKYGIPQTLFTPYEKESRYENHFRSEDIANLHKELNTKEKGKFLLSELGLFEQYPHFTAKAKKDRHKLVSTMFGYNKKYASGTYPNELTANTMSEEYIDIINKILPCSEKKASTSGNKYTCGCKVSTDYDMLFKMAEKIVAESEEKGIYLEVAQNAKLTDKKYDFTPFSHMIKGMKVPVLENENIVEDEIVEVSKELYKGYVYDLNIAEVRNFLANSVSVKNCIYSWRGAEPKILLNIHGTYDLHQKYLPTNYRCKSLIVERAKRCIENNTIRSNKSIEYDKEGGVVEIVDTCTNDLYVISKYTYEKIYELLEKGVEESEIAIFVRNNIQATVLNGLMILNDIDHNYTPDVALAGTMAFKDMRTILDIVQDRNMEDAYKVSNFAWKFIPYIGTSGANKIGNIMRNYNVTLREALGTLVIEILSKNVNEKRLKLKPDEVPRINSYDAEYALYELYSLLSNDKLDDIKLFKGLSGLYKRFGGDFLYKGEDKQRQLKGVIDFVGELLKEKDLKDTIKDLKYIANTTDLRNGVNIKGNIVLSTEHLSKGLEWEYTFKMCTDTISVPSFISIKKMCDSDVKLASISDYIEQERRLEYVASTRAKNELYHIGNMKMASPFLLESLGVLNNIDERSTIESYNEVREYLEIIYKSLSIEFTMKEKVQNIEEYYIEVEKGLKSLKESELKEEEFKEVCEKTYSYEKKYEFNEHIMIMAIAGGISDKHINMLRKSDGYKSISNEKKEEEFNVRKEIEKEDGYNIKKEEDFFDSEESLYVEIPGCEKKED